MVIDTGSVQADVYGGGSGSGSPPVYQVVGSETKTGCCVTVDGAATGEITANNVVATWVCVTVGSNAVCGLGEAQNRSNPNLGICREGDSGGPVYEHQSDYSDVLANGTIDIGGRSLDGGNTFTQCYYELASDIEGSGINILG